jgi:hypothetical protein
MSFVESLAVCACISWLHFLFYFFKRKESKDKGNEPKQNFITISRSLSLSKHNSMISVSYSLSMWDQTHNAESMQMLCCYL